MTSVELKIEGLGSGDVERIRKLYDEITDCADLGSCYLKIGFCRGGENGQRN